MPQRIRPFTVPLVLAGVLAACASTTEQCKSACVHVFRDCLVTPWAPEQTANEQICEANCATRVESCTDEGAIYDCVKSASCDDVVAPWGQPLAACYARGGCDSLLGSGAFRPVRSTAYSDGQLLEVELSASDAGSDGCGQAASSTPAVNIQLSGPIAAGTFPINWVAPEGPRSSSELLAWFELSLTDEWGQYDQAVATSGSISIDVVDMTHVVGTFFVTAQYLDQATGLVLDGGITTLSGAFDAPTCLQVPPKPGPPNTINCGSIDFGEGDSPPAGYPLWLLAASLRARMRRRRR